MVSKSQTKLLVDGRILLYLYLIAFIFYNMRLLNNYILDIIILSLFCNDFNPFL